MYVLCFYTFFFFSSRRRHTRFDCDWSSDVCSSDLWLTSVRVGSTGGVSVVTITFSALDATFTVTRSEEHTSELQSQSNLVCRLLLEKKKTNASEQISTLSPPAYSSVMCSTTITHST